MMTVASTTDVDLESGSLYRIRDIHFQGSPRRILLQSQNGPCPLLALANVLILKDRLALPEKEKYIGLEDLIALISDLLRVLNTKRGDDDNWRENFEDSLSILPTLHVGMDVNVCFKDTEAFEFTKNLSVFDIFNIRLFHGWVVSKEDTVMHELLVDGSYNTVVQRIFDLQNDDSSPEDLQEAALLRNWLEENCSQLTVDGLDQLHASLKEQELGILFRNSHFATIFKHDGQLYLLNTDIGFLDSKFIWERFDRMFGDTTFVGHDFRPVEIVRNSALQPISEETASQVRDIFPNRTARAADDESARLHSGEAYSNMQLVPGSGNSNSRTWRYIFACGSVLLILFLLLYLTLR